VLEERREEDVEVLLTDWGSEIPLRKVLQLSLAAARLVAFIIVPPALAKEIQGDSPFSEVHALNAAARYATGQYVGRIDQDTLVGKRFLRTFFELYEGKRQMEVPLHSALMLSNRRQIPYRFAFRCPSFREVDRFMRWFGRFLDGQMFHLPPHAFLISMVGIWLVHRDVWFECGGYNERMKYYNWMEAEMIVRLMQREYKVVDLGKLVNYDLYHLEHLPLRGPRLVNANRKENPGFDIRNPPQLEFNPNGEDWGLIKYPLELVRYVEEKNAAPIAHSKRLGVTWTSFALLLVTAVMMLWDRLLAAFAPRWNVFLSRWTHRGGLVSHVIRRQPVGKWPEALRGLWLERQSRLTKE